MSTESWCDFNIMEPLCAMLVSPSSERCGMQIESVGRRVYRDNVELWNQTVGILCITESKVPWIFVTRYVVLTGDLSVVYTVPGALNY